MPNNIQNLEKSLNLVFKDKKLLIQALTHRSYLNESSEQEFCSNERLEFLGDAILGFIVSHWLYTGFPHLPEGTLTNLRSALVKTETLAQIAQKIKIGQYLLLSKGEAESGGQNNPTLLANCIEALIGAIFLDQGLEIVTSFVISHLEPKLLILMENGQLKDAKSLLQEKMQAKFKATPIYKVINQIGPDHNKTFTIGVYCQEKLITTAKGKSKQEAEENAAKLALEKISF